MYNLDDPRTYSTLDPTNLGQRLRDLPAQCKAAWQQTRAVALPKFRTPINHVIIAGMGGSAIAGDLVADLAAPQSTVPITVVRDIHLPFALDDHSLVIACSYSGNTRETLSLFHQAVEAQAAVVAVTGGGVLAQRAAEVGVLLLPVNTPGEARSAVGHNLMVLLGLLHRLELVETKETDVQTAVAALAQRIAQLVSTNPTRDNPAKQLAQELEGKLPMVYGGGLFRGVARRWKTQFNENAKVWAFFETIPELLHNSVESYSSGPAGQPLMVLLLQPDTGPMELESHYEVVSELLNRNSVTHRVLQGDGGTPLAQLLGILVLGDYVSYYLALLRGVDPSPTPTLEEGKELLAGS